MPLLADKRGDPRIPVNLDGRLLSIDGRCNLFCVIADLSQSGARVRTRHGAFVPDRVYLRIDATGDVFDCDRRWARDNEAGLSLIGQANLSIRKVLAGLGSAAPSRGAKAAQ